MMKSTGTCLLKRYIRGTMQRSSSSCGFGLEGGYPPYRSSCTRGLEGYHANRSSSQK